MMSGVAGALVAADARATQTVRAPRPHTRAAAITHRRRSHPALLLLVCNHRQQTDAEHSERGTAVCNESHHMATHMGSHSEHTCHPAE